jgi:hypothetical protein
MNAAQICRRALLDANLVKIDGTTSPLITQIELMTWATEGKDKIEKVLRQAKEDYQLVVLQRDDAAFRWAGQTYDPAANLRITGGTTGTRFITLPPDLLELRNIRTVTTGEESRGWELRNLSDPEFVSKRNRIDTDTTSGTLMCAIVGDRTLLLAQIPETTLDIEITYIARSAPMQIYTDGTISTSQSSATVTGTSTEWIVDELMHSMELIVSGDATAPKVASQTAGGTFVDPSRFYYRVDTFSADGTLMLSAPWLPTGVSGRGYMLATVPHLSLYEHHHTISKWVQACAKAKVYGWDKFAEYAAPFFADMGEITADIAQRQSHDPQYVEDMVFD